LDINILKIDPNIRLSLVPLFRFTLKAFPLLALLCLIIILINSNLEFDFSYVGFNFGLFTLLKVPLALLAACITILGVIAAIHRSAQITLQIEKTTEQNVFSNFYKHREEYVSHFNEVSEKFPEHISCNISDKIIRGYYSSSYPLNNPSSFNIKSRLGWIESFDKGLIEVTYVFSKMSKTRNVILFLTLYKTFIQLETSLRQGFFDIRTPEEAEFHSEGYRKIKIHYPNGSTSNIFIYKRLLESCFSRIKDYAEFLTKLKYLSDEFEGTLLYGTDVYCGLSTMQHLYQFDEELIDLLFDSDTENIEFKKSDEQSVSEVFDQIRKLYDRKIKELDSIKDAN